jgi:hypothetical protein
LFMVRESYRTELIGTCSRRYTSLRLDALQSNAL